MNKFLYKYNKYFKILISFLFYLYVSKRFRHSLEEKLIIKQLIINKKDSLKKFPKNKDELLYLEKEKLLEFISQRIGKNITKIKSIFIGNRMRFGNSLIALYKIIFYCQILFCKNIFLDKNKIWFIRKNIINKKYKMIIKPINKNNIKNKNIIIDKTSNFYYYYMYIIPIFRIKLLKIEILRNIPKIIINKKDLYIYIRSGDIFIFPEHHYSQAPLCFYQKILNYYKFRKIYLIAEDKNNPVIQKLLDQYPNIIYNQNNLKIDIAYLVYAYNIVGGKISTFLGNILYLNDNLLIIWIFVFKKYIKKKKSIIYFQNKIKKYKMYGSHNYINQL